MFDLFCFINCFINCTNNSKRFPLQCFLFFFLLFLNLCSFHDILTKGEVVGTMLSVTTMITFVVDLSPSP